MASSSYLGSVPGILKLITVLVGVIIFALALAAWPRESIRLAIEANILEAEIWKFYFLFGVSIVAVLFSVVTALVFVFAGKSAKNLKTGDAIVSILVGILLLVGAALLLQEIVKHHDDLIEGCDLGAGSSPFGIKSTKSVEDDAAALAKCAVDNIGDAKGRCYCGVKTLLKYNLNVGAGAIAVINSILLMAAGGVGFAMK